jgi:shikimate kinase
MKQIILIGFSTTGKTTLARKIAKRFPNRSLYDTDKVISEPFGGSVSDIYYAHPNVEDTHRVISGEEKKTLMRLKSEANNLIIAAGPGIPLHEEDFMAYVKSKSPIVVLLNQPAEKIYTALCERRERYREDAKHSRPDFGIWDLGIMVERDGDTIFEIDKQKAIENISRALDERAVAYKKFATLSFDCAEIFESEDLPNRLLELL